MNVNHDHDYESEFERRLRTLPADDEPRPEHRDALRDQALAAFDRAAQTAPRRPDWKQVLHFGRDFMQRPIPRYLAAAAAFAAVAWILITRDTVAAPFEKLIDNLVSAKSARFQAEVKVEGQPKQTSQVAFLAPAKYRMVLDKAVNISDFEAAKMLSLVADQKTAVVFNLKNMPKDPKKTADMNHFEHLRHLLSEERGQLPPYERLGEKTIDGKKAVGFRLDAAIGTVTLWGDPKTGYPIRIENIYTGVPKTEVVMTKFEMNVELNNDLFTMDIPRGYKVMSFDVEASRAEERDFIEGLRTFAEMSGGTFPDALDTQSAMKIVIDSAVRALVDKKAGQPKEPDMQKLMNESMKIGRGFQFALSLPATAKPHYAGKGVKKNTKDRPIFWYLPEGSTRYRVIDATLTGRDADEAPNVEGAVPLGRKAGGGESQ